MVGRQSELIQARHKKIRPHREQMRQLELLLLEERAMLLKPKPLKECI